MNTLSVKWKFLLVCVTARPSQTSMADIVIDSVVYPLTVSLRKEEVTTTMCVLLEGHIGPCPPPRIVYRFCALNTEQ